MTASCSPASSPAPPAAVRAASLELMSDKLFTVFRYFHGSGQPTLIPEPIHKPQIDGTLRLDLSTEYRLKHITITLEGISSSHVPCVRKAMLLGRKRTSTVKCSVATSTSEKIIWQEVAPLPPRIHVFAFTIGLPNAVPPTFYGQHGSVFYTLRATITPRGPLSKPFSVSRPVYVRRCLVHPPELPVTATYSGTLAGGSIRYCIEVPKFFACTGGHLKAVVNMEQGNQAPNGIEPRVRVRQLECALREVSKYKGLCPDEKVTCVPKNKKFRHVSCIENLSTPRVRRDLTQHERDFPPLPVQLHIGVSNAQPDLTCRTVEVRHALRLKVIVEHDGVMASCRDTEATSVHRVDVPIIGFSPPPNPAFHYAPWTIQAHTAVQRLMAEMREKPTPPPESASLRTSEKGPSAISRLPLHHQPREHSGSLASVMSTASVAEQHECETMMTASDDFTSAPTVHEVEDASADCTKGFPSSALNQSGITFQQIEDERGRRAVPDGMVPEEEPRTSAKPSRVLFDDEITVFPENYSDPPSALPQIIAISPTGVREDTTVTEDEKSRQACTSGAAGSTKRATGPAAGKSDSTEDAGRNCGAGPEHSTTGNVALTL